MSATPPPGHPAGEPTRVRWRVVRETGPAEDFHRRDPDGDPGHQFWILRPSRPTLVLGSTQPAELVRTDRAATDGIEVCRRRSGGGLVYLDPATDCWLDAIVPVGSPLWHDDVGRAFHWLGRRWADTISDLLGPAGPALANHPRPTRAPNPRPLWCFAGIGHGEVTIGASKVVGLSQRRTRGWIRLQSLVLGAWPGRRLLPYLDLDVAAELLGTRPTGASTGSDPPLGADPARVRAGPPPGLRLPPPDELIDAFLDRTARRPDLDPVGTGDAEGPGTAPEANPDER